MADKANQGSKRPRIQLAKKDLKLGAPGKSKYSNPFFFLTTFIMVIVCSYALWLSANGIFEKLSLIRGLRQIENIVASTQQLAVNDRKIAESKNNDLIALLNNMGQLQSTQSTDGIEFVTNPWGGHVTAKTIANEQIWIETVVPSFVCSRLIAMLSQPDALTRAQSIQLNATSQLWMTIYSRSDNTFLHEAFVRANCRSAHEARLGILFNLHP